MIVALKLIMAEIEAIISRESPRDRIYEGYGFK
jgi:hypothetical protein